MIKEFGPFQMYEHCGLRESPNSSRRLGKLVTSEMCLLNWLIDIIAIASHTSLPKNVQQLFSLGIPQFCGKGEIL